jgi:hypothetical protein
MKVDISKSVQGVGLYAEFARFNATTQVIITPTGYNSDGDEVPMHIVRRTVTTTSPRKQWRFSTLVQPPHPILQLASEAGITIDAAKELYCDEALRYASSLFDQLSRGDWLIVGDPILVEVSKTDLDAVKVAKTPTKLLYRINQCRIAQGYPADLVNETTPATV